MTCMDEPHRPHKSAINGDRMGTPCWELVPRCLLGSPLLGAGSVKLGCLAQTPASWGPSVMTILIDAMGSWHDDVIKWKHFPRYWPFVRGIHRPPVNSPHKGQRRRALMFSLICARINGWVNNRKAGDLRRNHAHYDVSVMEQLKHWAAIAQIRSQPRIGADDRECNTGPIFNQSRFKIKVKFDYGSHIQSPPPPPPPKKKSITKLICIFCANSVVLA